MAGDYEPIYIPKTVNYSPSGCQSTQELPKYSRAAKILKSCQNTQELPKYSLWSR